MFCLINVCWNINFIVYFSSARNQLVAKTSRTSCRVKTTNTNTLRDTKQILLSFLTIMESVNLITCLKVSILKLLHYFLVTIESWCVTWVYRTFCYFLSLADTFRREQEHNGCFVKQKHLQDSISTCHLFRIKFRHLTTFSYLWNCQLCVKRSLWITWKCVTISNIWKTFCSNLISSFG